MVIEGIRQLADPKRTPTGYKFENVYFNKALPVPSTGEGIETQLHFDRRRLATRNSFESDDFTIFAYVGEEWLSLCVGTVIMEHAIQDDEDDIQRCAGIDRLDVKTVGTFSDKQCSDEIHANQFYQNLAAYGFQYGPTFRLLQDIRFNQDGQARANIQLGQWENQEGCGSTQEHVIHPTALDSLGQLCMAAVSKGSWDVIPTMVPTRFASLWISNSLLESGNNSKLDLYASLSLRGYREAEFSIVAQDSENKAQIIAEAWRETGLDAPNCSAWDRSRIRGHGILWKPDVTLLTGTETTAVITKAAPIVEVESSTCSHEISPFESLEIASIYLSELSVKEGHRLTQSSTAHIQLHSKWILGKVNKSKINETSPRQLQVQKMLEDKTYTDDFLTKIAESTAEGDLLVKLGVRLGAILAGETTAHEILLNQQLMSRYLRSSRLQMMYSKAAAFIDLLAHRKPDQRILEINSGDGALTDAILGILAPVDGIAGEVHIPKFSSYDHTDPSHAFFQEVSGRFQHFSTCLKCRTLDLVKDAVDQGFESESYDVVIGRTVCGLSLEWRFPSKWQVVSRGPPGSGEVAKEFEETTEAVSCSIEDLIERKLKVSVEGN